MIRRNIHVLLAILSALPALLALPGSLQSAAKTGTAQMRMAVTTSFHNSGLSDILLPVIEQELGLKVQLLVVGTGQALRLGQAGDVSAILVHAPAAEEEFVAQGYGVHRREIMYNDFVFIGPAADPAGLREAKGVSHAMQKLAAAQYPFVSRGDNSGTHNKELELWRAAGLRVAGFGSWYRAVGAGMGAALNTASAMNAYIMADRASWLNFGNRADLAVVFADDEALFNQYTYIPVTPQTQDDTQYRLALALEAWLTSERAETLINAYTIDGQALFVFNARKAAAR